jgi:hypothetical protein
MNRSRRYRSASPLDGMKAVGRKLRLNTFYDAVWRHPLRDLRALVRDGGPIQRRRTEAGHLEMQGASKTLPTMQPPNHDQGDKVHVLTGKRFWHQSVYCAASLQIVSESRITPVFYSDGSLTGDVQEALLRVLPWAEFVPIEVVETKLDAVLPISQFPTLRKRRETYVHLRKLTDIHVFGQGWKMVLDSDLLFFRTPSAMLAWFREPVPLCMADITDNYGFPLDYLQSMVEGLLPKRFNVGLYGMDSSSVDWSRLEWWCSRQLADFGPSYLQEQGLTAMLMAGKDVLTLPSDEYVLLPKIGEGRDPRAVMHHYVAESKRSYFQYGWREVDRRIREKAACRPMAVDEGSSQPLDGLTTREARAD